MASVSYTVKGNQVHGGGPTMTNNLTITVTRASKQTSAVTISVSGTIKLTYSTGYYGVPPSGVGICFSNSSGTSTRYGNYYSITTSTKSVSESWTIDWTSGNLTIYSHCCFNSGLVCDKGYTNVALQSISISSLPYNPSTPPSPVPSGTTWTYYGGSDTQNGKVKPDENVKWKWENADPGTYGPITQYNIDMYREKSDAGTIVATVANASKNTWYNIQNFSFNSAVARIHPGETIYCYINSKLTSAYNGSYWTRKKVYR